MKATGPGKTEKRTKPESLMLFNFDIDGDNLKEEHVTFLRDEALPTLRAGGGVSVIGLTDRRGTATHNKKLSNQRVASTIAFLKQEVPAGLNLRPSTGFGEDAAAQEGAADGTLDERFRSVLVFLFPVTQTKVIEVTVKSFIATVGTNVGSMPGTTIVAVPAIPISPVILVPVQRQTLLNAMAATIDAQFNENPLLSTKDKRYRLFSKCRFTVVFEGKKILATVPGIPDLDTDVGTEPPTGGLQPDPLIVSPVSVSPKGDSFVTFSWDAKGRPHVLAEPPFLVVNSRTSVFIWHSISGRIDISSGTPVTTTAIQGSQFPSHRAFIDDQPVFPDRRQGPLSNLWVSDPADATKVR